MATSSPTTQSGLTEDYCCGYCLQRLSYMVDPRELPCSHVFCLPCLQADFRKTKRVDCTICSQSHGELDLEALVKVNFIVQGHMANENTYSQEQKTPCDLCEEVEEASVCYCPDCDKKLCQQHFKMHTLFVNKTHQPVDIEIYSKNPSRYQSERCSTHKEEKLILTCNKCYQIFCLRCQTEDGCTETVSKLHGLVQLERSARLVREQIGEEMKALSDKITEICKLEKAAWQSLDEVEVKVREMKAEVDRVTEEQVKEIRDKSVAIKGKIQEYLTQSTKYIEDYTATLISSKEHMQNMWRSAQQQMAASGDAELVNKHNKSLKELKQLGRTKVKDFKPFIGSLTPTGLCRSLEVKFVIGGVLPTKLKFFKANETHSNSVCWTRDNNLISTGHGNITLYDKTLTKLKSGYVQYGVSVSECNGQYIVMAYISQSCDISESCDPTLYSSNLKAVKKIDKLTKPGDRQATFNRSGSEIIVIDHPNQQLKIYNTAQMTHLFSVKLEGFAIPNGIHTLSDDYVLVSDDLAGFVSKYRLSANTLQLIWKCAGLNKPTGISSDEAGHIYVASGAGVIYVLSEDGTKLADLTSPELTGVGLMDVSVLDDQIAVACSVNGIKIFRLCH